MVVPVEPEIRAAIRVTGGVPSVPVEPVVPADGEPWRLGYASGDLPLLAGNAGGQAAV